MGNSDGVRKGDWRQTFHGSKFWPMDPRAEEINVEDLAHHLSTINRFGGSAREPYSVAQHLVMASHLVPLPLQFETLMHDGAEGLMGADVIRPVKRSGLLGILWEDAESRCQRAVHEAFGLPTGESHFVEKVTGVDLDSVTFALPHLVHLMPEEVKRADNVMLMTEARDLMAPPPEPWQESGNKPLEQKIVPWPWYKAKDEFLRRFHTLYSVPVRKGEV